MRVKEKKDGEYDARSLGYGKEGGFDASVGGGAVCMDGVTSSVFTVLKGSSDVSSEPEGI